MSVGAASVIVHVHDGLDWAAWATAAGTLILALITTLTLRSSLNQEKRTRDQIDRDRKVRDLDETRRLVLVALYNSETLQDPMLFGTIVNALAYHSGAMTRERAADVLWRFGNLAESGTNILEELVDWLNTELAKLGALPTAPAANGA